MILSNTLQFQCFCNLNKYLWAIFSQKFWKLMALSFEWGCYGSKFLKTIISYLLKSVNLRSELGSHQMYSKSKGSLISISSESSKIHRLTFADDISCSTLWMSPCGIGSSFIMNVLVLRFLDMKYFSFANVSIPV